MKVLLVLLLVGIASSTSDFSNEHEGRHPGYWNHGQSSEELSLANENLALADRNPNNIQIPPGMVWGPPEIKNQCQTTRVIAKPPNTKTTVTRRCLTLRVQTLRKAPTGSQLPTSSEEGTFF